MTGEVFSRPAELAAVDQVEEPASSLEWWLLDRPMSRPIRVASEREPYVSLEVGGSVREQFEAYRNFELNPEFAGWDTYHLHRLMVHGDLQVGEHFGVMAEVGNATVTGKRNPLAPVDEDELFLHQAHVRLAFEDAFGSVDAVLRVGRQEMSFGSGRLVSLRDGPNIRRSFDAASLWLGGEGWRIEAFGGAEVRLREDVFDNRPSGDVLFWGVYGTVDDVLGRGVHLDAYYMGIDRDRAVFEAGVAGETRHSIGVRLWGSAGRFDFNFEPVIQLGQFGDRDIRAWTIASDTGWRLSSDPDAPRLGLRANIISGGQDDDRLATFNALFPNNSYFSEAAVVAPSNLIDINPNLTFHPAEGLTITALWDFLWRFDRGDAIYGPPGVPILDGGGSGRFIGHSISLNVQYEVTERLTLFGSYAHFQAGDAVREAGGENLDYVLTGLEWRF